MDSGKKTSIESGGLYVVATPIGNLEDFSPRAIETLKLCDIIAAESVEQTKKLLFKYGLKARIVSFRESNRETAIPFLLCEIESGKNIALVSDGGAPLVSDPGRELVAAAIERKIKVTPIPGPSAVIASLMASPLAGDFCFLGFLPRSGEKALSRIKPLVSRGLAVVIFEAPNRAQKTLDMLDSAFGEELSVTIGREITKVNESFYYGSPKELKAALGNEIKGEITMVVKLKNPPQTELKAVDWRDAAQALAGRGVRNKDISVALAAVFGLDSGAIYDYLISLKQHGRNE